MPQAPKPTKQEWKATLKLHDALKTVGRGIQISSLRFTIDGYRITVARGKRTFTLPSVDPAGLDDDPAQDKVYRLALRLVEGLKKAKPRPKRKRPK